MKQPASYNMDVNHAGLFKAAAINILSGLIVLASFSSFLFVFFLSKHKHQI